MKHSAWNKTWLGALIAFVVVWFPPAGILAVINIAKSKLLGVNADSSTQKRNMVKLRYLLKTGFICGLFLFTFLCAYVFFCGGDMITKLDTFF